MPEKIRPDSAEWARHHLHCAANLLHVQAQHQLSRNTNRLYRVAWMGGCAVIPSRADHMECVTTIAGRDTDAARYFYGGQNSE